jgi:hypothetical protein
MSYFTPVANPFGLKDRDLEREALGGHGDGVEVDIRLSTNWECHG